MHSHLCPGCRLVEIVTVAPGSTRLCFTCADSTPQS